MSRLLCILFLGLTLFPHVADAQPDPWERVGLIGPGRRVEVRQADGNPISGTFAGFDSTQIKVLRGGGDVMAIAKGNVKRVSLVIGKSRGKKAAIAAGVTAGALGTLVAAACIANNTCAGDGAGLAAGVIASWSMIAGGIAALFPPHKETIFETPPGPTAGGSAKTSPPQSAQPQR